MRILSGFKFILGSGILTSAVSLGTDIMGIFSILGIWVSLYFCVLFKKIMTCYVPTIMWQL